MILSDINRDKRFKKVCNSYDVYWRNSKVYGDFVLLRPTDDIYILLDKNFNPIAIESALVSDEKAFVKSLCREYSTYSLYLDYNLDYPFKNYNLQKIIDMSNRITIISQDNKEISEMIVNGVKCSYKKRDDYLQLLFYIKFLGKIINDYQYYIFINKKNGMTVKDSNIYISGLIRKINEFIDICINNKKVPTTNEVISYVGKEDIDYAGYELLLNEILELLLRQKSYKIEENKLKKIPTSNINNLDEKAKQLLEILNLSDHDFLITKNNRDPLVEPIDLFEILNLEERHFNLKKKRILKK